jgi:hypothetical protein
VFACPTAPSSARDPLVGLGVFLAVHHVRLTEFSERSALPDTARTPCCAKSRTFYFALWPLGLGAIRSGSMGCRNFDNVGFPCRHYPTCSAASPSPRNHRSRSFPKLACHRLDPQIGPALTPPRAERTAGRLNMSMSRDRRLGRRVQKACRGTRRPKSGGYARR